MKRQGNNRIFLTMVLLIGLLLIGEACWGERAVPLQIENRTDIILTIYVQDIKVGEVEPKNSIKVKNLGMNDSYFIEAKYSTGEVIYSRKFSLTELHDADWKVVIPPLQGQITGDSFSATGW
jgi:hypothetical protein